MIEDTQPVNSLIERQSESRLGELVASYHGQRFRWRDIYLLVIPGVIASIGLVGYGLWQIQKQASQVGTIQALNINQTWFILAYLIFMFFFAMTLVRIGDDLRFVSIHSHGLRWRLDGFHVRSMTWSDIEGIATSSFRDYFIKLPLREHYHAMFYPAHGKPVGLYDDLINLPELVTHLKAILYPSLLSRHKAALDSGDKLTFGSLILEKSGLHVLSKKLVTEFSPQMLTQSSLYFIPWSEVEQVTIQSGFLVVKSSSHGLLQIPISHIPNYELLYKLIEQGLN
jgi:hypothetical protein